MKETSQNQEACAFMTLVGPIKVDQGVNLHHTSRLPAYSDMLLPNTFKISNKKSNLF